MSVRRVLPYVAAGLLLVGCESSSSKKLPSTRPVAVAPAIARNSENGQSIRVAEAQELVIRLASNPTTGFSWKVAVIDGDHLQQVGEGIFEHADPQMVGAGGTQVFTFKPKKKGKTTLVLDYVRPWEQKPAETTFTLNVMIDE